MEFFYGQAIDPNSEQNKIEKILSKYRHEPVSEELKKKIHQDLTEARTEGKISIPFKVVMRKDTTNAHHDYIEIILDTKV